ncbi:MAG TPA: glycosyltransferase family A protein [Caldimonas sp.]|jgi:glycosyltransferase involved in cell wall biosynthesis|nr:glycosyltransferase family A protein [Caldimonas sp.]
MPLLNPATVTPTFAVVIPAYQSAATIEACLQSVAAQTVLPEQVVVVDDHSRDGTAAIAEGSRGPLASRGIELQVIRQPANGGPSRARNAGMAQTRTSHIAFLDADDIWHPNKLEVVRPHLGSGNDPALLYHAYTDESVFSVDTAQPPDYRAVRVRTRDLLVRNSAQTSCVVIRRDRGVRFEETLRYCEDYDLWLRIVEARPVVRLIGPALTRLGRPQLTQGGLSGNRHRMRAGEMAAYLRFCSRRWFPRFALLPALLAFSLLKHGTSGLRRIRRATDAPPG